MKRIVAIAVFWMVCVAGYGQGLEASALWCELAQNPVGLETETLRLGWTLIAPATNTGTTTGQSAYQIIVSTDRRNVASREQGDVWNSGKVPSTQSQFIPYHGKSLEKGKRYYWRVRVWDTTGKPSRWSQTAYWEMAPDFAGSNAEWIGAITKAQSGLPEGRTFHSPSMKNAAVAAAWGHVDPLAKRSILLRKEITVKSKKKLTKATVAIAGLGHYELMLNGKRVGKSVFAPLWSDYDKSVYYNLYDVHELLQPGTNAIGVILGNGMYNVTGDRYRKLWVSFGPPTLRFQLQLEYNDGSTERVVSDGSWRYSESPITFNCIYGGEDYDARLEQAGWDKPGFTATSWKPVVIQEAPKGVLRAQVAPPVEEFQRYGIKKVHQPKPGMYVLDMGQNLSGYPSIRVSGKAGQVVKLVVGEALGKDSTVNQKRSGSPYYFEYTLKGTGVEEWKPRFSYYGYQYIQVEGVDLKTGTGDKPVLLDIQSHFIYNNGANGEIINGPFTCSNDLFNNAHRLIHNAVLSNWQGVFTDCPHREKLGWLEETYLNGPALFFNYNLAQFIPKVMQDIADGQRPDGLVPSIVPEYVVFGGDFTDSPEWGVAAVVLPWMYYEYYGDTLLLQKHYTVMKRYVDYLASRADTYIVSHGLGDWYDYGDHAAGYAKNSPIPLSATAHFYLGATLVARAAVLLGHTIDADTYTALSNNIRDAFNNTFFHADTKQYGTGSQYSNAIPLYLGIVNDSDREAVLANLIADVRQRGNRLTTGDIGNRYLYMTLANSGRNDVMYALHNHEDAPGYGFQIKFGLTTLTEQWDPRKGNSWNHFMMGQIDEWFYTSVAGITPDLNAPGFKHFFIKPQPAGDLTFARASHTTFYGKLSSDWTIRNNTFALSVEVPVNTTATVVLPDGSRRTISAGKHEFSCPVAKTH